MSSKETRPLASATPKDLAALEAENAQLRAENAALASEVSALSLTRGGTGGGDSDVGSSVAGGASVREAALMQEADIQMLKTRTFKRSYSNGSGAGGGGGGGVDPIFSRGGYEGGDDWSEVSSLTDFTSISARGPQTFAFKLICCVRCGQPGAQSAGARGRGGAKRGRGPQAYHRVRSGLTLSELMLALRGKLLPPPEGGPGARPGACGGCPACARLFQHLVARRAVLQYKDEDGDPVDLTSDAALEEGVVYAKARAHTALRVFFSEPSRRLLLEEEGVVEEEDEEEDEQEGNEEQQPQRQGQRQGEEEVEEEDGHRTGLLKRNAQPRAQAAGRPALRRKKEEGKRPRQTNILNRPAAAATTTAAAHVAATSRSAKAANDSGNTDPIDDAEDDGRSSVLSTVIVASVTGVALAGAYLVAARLKVPHR